MAWPLGVPDRFQEDTLKPAAYDNLIHSNADAGVGDVRVLYTGVPEAWNGDMVMSLTAYDILEQYHQVTLRFGSLPDDWVHPTKRTACRFRFLAKPVPSTFMGDMCVVPISFVILPQGAAV